jgi:hypothetical protein
MNVNIGIFLKTEDCDARSSFIRVNTAIADQPTLGPFYSTTGRRSRAKCDTLADTGKFDSCKYLINQSKYSKSSSSLAIVGGCPRTGTGKVDSCSVH